MQTDDGDAALVKRDTEHEKRVRRLALILLVVLVVTLVGTMLVAGREYLHVSALMLLPGGLGIFHAIQLFRHPRRLKRPETLLTADEIIAHGGIHLAAGEHGTTPVETRLAVQDALDSIRQRHSFSRFGIPVQVAVGIGTVGWLAGAIASVVVGHDPAAAGICLVGAAAFGVFTVVSVRLGKRLGMAERALQEQLMLLDGPAMESLGGNGVALREEASKR